MFLLDNYELLVIDEKWECKLNLTSDDPSMWFILDYF